MNNTETLKELYPKINSILGELDNEIKISTKKIRKEYNSIITEEKIKLIKLICDGEKLNYNEIINKYLTPKERKNLNKVIDTIEIKKEDLLDTVIINDKMYFFENKEKGNIFDSNSKQVGIYKNGKHILFI